MPEDWDQPAPALVRDTASPGELVERLAEMMRRRDEAQKVATESRQEIARLVAAIRQQYPALVALLAEKPSPVPVGGAASPDVDWTRLPQNTRDG